MTLCPLVIYDNMMSLKFMEGNAQGDGNEDGERGIGDKTTFQGGLLSWSELHRRVPRETGKNNRNVEQSNMCFLSEPFFKSKIIHIMCSSIYKM